MNIGLSFQLSAFILLPRETKAITTRVRQSARPIRATRREKEEGGEERRDERWLHSACSLSEGFFSSPVSLLVKLLFRALAYDRLAMHEQSRGQTGYGGHNQRGFVMGL